MDDLTSGPRKVPSNRRLLWRAFTPRVGTVKLPSSSLHQFLTRAVYLRAFPPLIEKHDVFYRKSSVCLLIRLTCLPAEVRYARDSAHSYLCCSCHIFLALTQRDDAILYLARWIICLLNATMYRPMRWNASRTIESEVIPIPVRDLAKRRGSISGAVPSRKIDRMVHNESLIVRGHINIFEYDPSVQTYEELCTFHYRFDGSEHRYTSVLSVTWSGHKPVGYVSDPENALKWTAARLWRADHNNEIVLVTNAILVGMYGAIRVRPERPVGHQGVPHSHAGRRPRTASRSFTSARRGDGLSLFLCQQWLSRLDYGNHTGCGYSGNRYRRL